MKTETNEKIMKILYSILSLVVIIGALLKIYHFEIGSKLILYGLIAGTIVSAIEINQLKKIIKKYESEKNQEAK